MPSSDPTFTLDAVGERREPDDCDAWRSTWSTGLLRNGTATRYASAGDCDGPGPTPGPDRDDASALLAAERRYDAAYRAARRGHTDAGVTAARHDLERVRAALGLRAHLP